MTTNFQRETTLRKSRFTVQSESGEAMNGVEIGGWEAKLVKTTASGNNCLLAFGEGRNDQQPAIGKQDRKRSSNLRQIGVSDLSVFHSAVIGVGVVGAGEAAPVIRAGAVVDCNVRNGAGKLAKELLPTCNLTLRVVLVPPPACSLASPRPRSVRTQASSFTLYFVLRSSATQQRAGWSFF